METWAKRTCQINTHTPGRSNKKKITNLSFRIKSVASWQCETLQHKGRRRWHWNVMRCDPPRRRTLATSITSLPLSLDLSVRIYCCCCWIYSSAACCVRMASAGAKQQFYCTYLNNVYACSIFFSSVSYLHLIFIFSTFVVVTSLKSSIYIATAMADAIIVAIVLRRRHSHRRSRHLLR